LFVKERGWVTEERDMSRTRNCRLKALKKGGIIEKTAGRETRGGEAANPSTPYGGEMRFFVGTDVRDE
jgi:hypothetical protein